MKSSRRAFTLRELVCGDGVSFHLVYKHIHRKYKKYPKCDRLTYEQVKKVCSGMIAELMAIPSKKPYKLPICVRKNSSVPDEKPFIEVVLYNPKYVAPKKGLKPWGCSKGEKPPEGHYDCNADRHNEFFAFGYTAWSKLIDTPVVVDGNVGKLSWPAILAEIIWELTFFGWTEKEQRKNLKELKKRLKESVEDIKEGRFIELDTDTFLNESAADGIAELLRKSNT